MGDGHAIARAPVLVFNVFFWERKRVEEEWCFVLDGVTFFITTGAAFTFSSVFFYSFACPRLRWADDKRFKNLLYREFLRFKAKRKRRNGRVILSG